MKKIIMEKLTIKQEKFCQEYLINLGNASKAYRVAYNASKMKDKQVWEEASKLLATPKVAQRVAELSEEALKRNNITVDKVLNEIATIAFLDMKEFYCEDNRLKSIHEIEETARRAIHSITTREERNKVTDDIEIIHDIKTIKSSDKLKALELLGKYLKMFTDKVEHSGTLEVIDPFKKTI